MSVLIENIFTGEKRYINGTSTDIVAPWVLDLDRFEFVRLKIFSLMQKVMTDCYRFSSDITNVDKRMSLFDSVVYKNAQYGLLSEIAYLISNKSKEYIVYDSGIIRKATTAEKKLIDKDYKNGMTYSNGVIVDFSNYALGKLLSHYFHQIYSLEDANNKSISLGGSIQYKVDGLRMKVGLEESKSPSIQAQASDVCKSAKDGKPIVIDSQDSVEQTDSSTNVSVSQESKKKIYQELAATLGCTVAYIVGSDESTNGSGDSYERLDGRNEDMIKNFWITIFNPIVSALYGENLNFISQKWQTIKENLGSISMIEGLKSIPDDNKASIIAKLIGENEPNPKSQLETNIKKLLVEEKENNVTE